jgi:hypothetical protein
MKISKTLAVGGVTIIFAAAGGGGIMLLSILLHRLSSNE